MSNIWLSLRYMKFHNKDKNKGKLQSFVSFTIKVNYNDFSGFTFYIRPYNIFLLIFILFEHVKVGKHIEYMRWKLSNYMLIVKFHLEMKRLHFFFMKFYLCLFHRDEFIPGWKFIWEKRANSKRHFPIGRDDFIQDGWKHYISLKV